MNIQLSSDYNELLLRAHSGAAMRVSPTVAVWQVGFSPIATENTGGGDDINFLSTDDPIESAEFRARWIRKINENIRQFNPAHNNPAGNQFFKLNPNEAFEGAFEWSKDPFYREEILNVKSIYEISGFDAQFHLRTEALIITFFLNIERIVEYFSSRVNLSFAQERFIRNIKKAHAQIESSTSKRSDEDKAQDGVEYFYNDVWSHAITAKQNAPFDQDIMLQMSQDLGPIFCNLRGFIFPYHLYRDYFQRDIGGNQYLRSFDQERASHFLLTVNSLRRALTSKTSEDADKEIVKPREVVANLFSGGRITYISSLGSHFDGASSISVSSSSCALRFAFIHVGENFYSMSSGNNYELCRWIQRILDAGTLRMMAFRELQEIYFAGSEIRLLDKIVQSFRIKGSLKINRENIDINKLERYYAKIGSRSSGSLIYRINRSIAYSEAFRRMVASFDWQTIPGWQPYELFVQRRINKIFGNVAQVKSEYLSVGEDIKIISSMHDEKRREYSHFLLIVLGLLIGVFGSIDLFQVWFDVISESGSDSAEYKAMKSQWVFNSFWTVFFVLLVFTLFIFPKRGLGLLKELLKSRVASLLPLKKPGRAHAAADAHGDDA
ncbi:MAG: hypothetical protein ACFB2Z_07575 [Maricaulaceae bacterium]